MKALYALLFALFSALALEAQQQLSITPSQYQQLKDNGQLNPAARYVFADTSFHPAASAERVVLPVSAQSITCNCLVPLDSTFQVVPFAFGTPPDYRNDDGSTPPMAIPFQFDFYGTLYDSIYINNNGNISFGSSYGSFTADSFPSSYYSMIAPFWADVDTRGSGSGLVYYKIIPSHVIIRWDSVGYYSNHFDKRNTFQLIITNGLDSILPPNTNVGFCYGDMQWTTGDASNGVNGFGGVASTTGVNKGDSISYFQVTRSVDSTSAFDGPYGADDGVSWLDEMGINFNTSIVGNIPPLVMNNVICDTIDVYTGDTLRVTAIDSIEFDFYSMTPEAGQTVTTTITTNAPAAALTYVQTVNTPTGKVHHCLFDARNLPPGSFWITATATDNGTPALTTTSTVYIETHYDSTLVVHEAPYIPDESRIYPNPAGVGQILTVEDKDAASIQICNLNGSVITSVQATGSRSEINIAALADGVYIVQIVHVDGSTSAHRFIRQ